MSELAVRPTSIPGLLVVDLVVHGDARGWFKESYQRQKLEALGLPRLEVVQNNISFNAQRGTTRGIHAEPWEKFISIASGSVFGAWVDVRSGPTFGKVETLTLTPRQAVFVSRGIANAYQTLESNVAYTYLVNEHWSPDAKYAAVQLFDPELGIPWPIGQDQAIVSDKDKANPLLKDLTPMEL